MNSLLAVSPMRAWLHAVLLLGFVATSVPVPADAQEAASGAKKSDAKASTAVAPLAKGAFDPAVHGCQSDADCSSTTLEDGDCCGLFVGNCTPLSRAYNKAFVPRLKAHQESACAAKRAVCPNRLSCRRAPTWSYPACTLGRCESVVVHIKNVRFRQPAFAKTDTERTACKTDADCVVTRVKDGLCCTHWCDQSTVYGAGFARRLKKHLRRQCGALERCKRVHPSYCPPPQSPIVARCVEQRCTGIATP